MSAALRGYTAAKRRYNTGPDSDTAAARGLAEAWDALPLADRLRVLLGEAARPLGFAVWEIRVAVEDFVGRRITRRA